MRILVTILTLALLGAWSPATTAQAQCTMWCPQGADAKAKAKPKKVAAVKKVKKEKVEYMKAAN